MSTEVRKFGGRIPKFGGGVWKFGGRVPKFGGVPVVRRCRTSKGFTVDEFRTD